MSEINVLDISVANLIAAGEVVDRPASALKELCENSIDAGAKTITAEIKNGGIAFMRVTDDGKGMTGEDAVICVRRHATSKIKTAKDLSAVMTLGFRGEALAAITAVTHTRIMTKRRADASGTVVTVDYGRLEGAEEGGFPDGTTVICEGLFRTTPARLKFLKSDSAEVAACASVMEKLALSHPEVAFRFIADGQQRFATSGDGKLKNAIYSVYGRDFASKLCEIDSKSGGISVSGYVGTPDNVRGNRALQIFFINNRCVRNISLTSALEAAFRSFAPIGKYPVCVLNIGLHAAYVDVNIHPAKLDVKFSDEKSIFDAVYYSVRGALERSLKNPSFSPKNPSPMTEEKLKIISAFVSPDAPKHEQTKIDMPFEAKYRPYVPTEKPTDKTESGEFAPVVLPKKVASPDVFDTPKAEEELPKINASTDAKLTGFEPKPVPEYRILGEAFDCYVIIEEGERLFLLDKHAAHERINFEKMKAAISGLKPETQLLMIEEKFTLSPQEREACEKYKKEISDMGFDFSIEDKGVILRGVPCDFELSEGRTFFFSLITSLTESEGGLYADGKNYFERALYQSACKASVKAGRKYDDAHVRWICDNFFRYDCIRRCPHGRPVAYEMTKRELDTRFGRIK
ncbi:MAG: DNA mismatch repair endonuclease MutL [Eubacteriales bacterium]|nr:DNA mismatch repair endonuclease MutL [Eubacteriales bacterium]